jgi:hypothetical protein
MTNLQENLVAGSKAAFSIAVWGVVAVLVLSLLAWAGNAVLSLTHTHL